MRFKSNDDLLALLLMLILILLAVCLISGVVLIIVRVAVPASVPEPDNVDESDSESENTDVSVTPVSVELLESDDFGMDYIDKMIFFGESTTAHLRSRGVLRDGTDTKQVWADSSGTKMLSSRITSESILYPETGENLTVAAACEKEKPEYLVLSFGLNGITGFIEDKNSYVRNYNRLIDAIQSASPETKIILQSVYPVTVDCDSFSVDGTTVNQYILTLNEWIQEIAASHQNVRYADTASVLRDENNALPAIYDNSGDGIHLTAAAYEQILYYLRTHAWQ